MTITCWLERQREWGEGSDGRRAVGTWRAVFDFFECICYAHCCCCFCCCCFFSSKTGCCCCCYVLGQHVVCVYGCWSLSRQRLQNKNILCNFLKAIFRCSSCCCCCVFALFLWYLSWDLNRNLGRISLSLSLAELARIWQGSASFAAASIENFKLVMEAGFFFNNKFRHFRKFQRQ